MSSVVTENVENNSETLRKWTPLREGLVFSEFISNWKEDEYGVDEKLVQKVSDESAEILSKCVDPKNTSEKNVSTGLVIGQVQSGKTLSMTAVSSMAKDNGFGIVIVMSGNISSLSGQTADRFEKALGGRNTIQITNNPEGNKWDPETNLMNVKNVLENFNETDNPDDKTTLLIVTHKNPARINHIVDLFENLGDLKNKIPTLIIDDEADHHSLNSKEFLNDINNLSDRRKRSIKEIHQISEGDTLESIANDFSTTEENLKEINNFERLPAVGNYILTDYIQTVTHSSIKDLRSNFNIHTYLGYTATPQAISLIPRINELSPEFVHVINTGENYTGLNFFFPKDNTGNYICSQHIENIEDEIEYNDLISDDQMPPSLEKALHYFIFSVAIGISKGEHNTKKNRSMIIHPHHLNEKQKDFYNFTVGVLRNLKSDLKNKDDVSYEITTKKLEENYNKYFKKFNKEFFPDFNTEFVEFIKKAVDRISLHIKLFNAKNTKIPKQNWKDAYARILIGGFGLDRGYTIQGLTVTYLSRSKSKQDDTLLQRARFFGYHKSYNEYVRVFLSRSSQNYYSEISEINDNFIGSVKKFQNTGKNFKNWPREWWGTNAASHELTRPGIRRDITLMRFNGDRPFTNKWSHQLSVEDLNQNRKICNSIYEDTKDSLIQISHMDIIKNSHKTWCGNRNILISEKFTIKEIYEEYFKHLIFHENEKTSFEVVAQNLAGYVSKFPNLKLPVLFMYINEEDPNIGSRMIGKNGAIQPWRGRDQKDNFPGDAILHYDYLIGATENNIGIDNLSLKINLFKKILNRDGSEMRKDVPYFHFVPSVKIWTDYIKGIYK